MATRTALIRHGLIWSRSRTYSKARSAFPAFQQHRFKSSLPVRDSEEEEHKPVPRKRSKPYLLDLGVPSLIPEWKKMFDTKTILTDISAGIAVGCIAVPLSLAIAMASGVPAEVGLATAAVSGIAGGLMGGTTLAVTGPAAAISMLVLGAVNTHGLMALPFITVTVGGLQVLSGVTRLGVYAKLVPVSVIAGFTTGVGALILSGQIPKALGMVAPEGLNPIEMIGWLGPNIADMSPASAALAFGTATALYALPKIHPKMPSAVIAVGGATAATHMLGLDVALIGTLPSGMAAFQFAMPVLPPLDNVGALVGTTLLIYLLTTVESLLSCVALDKMQKTDYKHNSDQELIVSTLYRT
jgi:carbonic anhydrase